MHDWSDFGFLNQRHEEMIQEAEQRRLANSLATGRGHWSRISTLVWEIRRFGGKALKSLRRLTDGPRKESWR